MIYFVGPISPPDNGPGVKNKILIENLLERRISTRIYNTLGFKNRLICLIGIFNLVFTNKGVILSVSEKGRYFFVPILAIASKMFRKKMVLLPAGGFLDVEIKKMAHILKKLYINSLNSFEVIFPESPKLAIELENIHIQNVKILPNPRKIETYKRKKFDKEEIQIFFISSIKKSKGVLDAIKAVEILNAKGRCVTLQIYGRVQDGFEKEFENALEINNNCQFNGMIPNNEVIKLLATKADILVLPTYYFGEGLPGILVEAAIANTPVIITNFKGIDAYFLDGINSLYVEEKDPIDLANKIDILIDNDELRKKITTGIAELSKQFDANTIVSKILEAL